MRARFACAALAAIAVLTSCEFDVSIGPAEKNTGSPNTSCKVTIGIGSVPVLVNGGLVRAIGDSAQFSGTVVVNPPGCISTAFHFTTSNSAIATIDATGKVRALATGVATIRLIVDADTNFNASVSVVVPGPPNVTIIGITVAPKQDTVLVGANKTPVITVKKSDGTTLVNVAGTFVCTSSDTTVAKIANVAACQALGVKAGTVNISVCAVGTTFCDTQVLVVVAPPPPQAVDSINYTPNGGTLKVGQTRNDLVGSCKLANGTTCGSLGFWTTDSPQIIHVAATDTTMVTNGVSWKVGVHATMTALNVTVPAAGITVTICFQQSVQVASLKVCKPWTITP